MIDMGRNLHLVGLLSTGIESELDFWVRNHVLGRKLS